MKSQKKTILFTEQLGSQITEYHKEGKNERIEKVVPNSSITTNVFLILKNFLRDILLPHGYPDTVSSDYFEYQLWDTLQAFCSTITGSFTTRAILKGVGVGNNEATALSATITWILKDGSGMIGRILFSWWKGMKLDCDCKKWRLFADFLNDVAMFIEIFVPHFSRTMEILCITSTFKSIVGIAGGATRASITQHQAVNNNMAEISAKDGTQETVVNLLASFSSIYLLGIITNENIEIPFLFFLMLLHLYFNFKAVKALIFHDLNESRMILLLDHYFNMNSIQKPSEINKKESVILGRGGKVKNICGFDIKLGCSLSKIIKFYSPEEIRDLFELYRDEEYVLAIQIKEKCVYVAYEKNISAQNVLASYFHAVVLAIVTSIHNRFPIVSSTSHNIVSASVNLEFDSTTNFSFQTGINDEYSNLTIKINSFIKNLKRENTRNELNFTFNELKLFNKFIKIETKLFLDSLQSNGWDVDNHSFSIDQWKIEWKRYLQKIE